VQVHSVEHKKTSSSVNSATNVDVQKLRTELRDAIKRADLKIVKNVNGKSSGDPETGPLDGKLFSYQLEGDRVEDATKRYNTNDRLQKVSIKLGAYAKLRRVLRNTSAVFLDVYPDEDTANQAKHQEDLRLAEEPRSPASKYYFRRKTGIVNPRGSKEAQA